MRTEPDLDQTKLLDCLRDRYRLEVDRLRFVPYGLDSWSYVAECRDGSRAFIKLARRAPAARSTWSEIPLLAALVAREVPVPRPIPDRDGGYLNEVDGYEVQVLEYLEGRNLEPEAAWPDALYGRLAETVATVHASTAAVRPLVERVERYDLPFLPGLAATLTLIEGDRRLPSGDDETFARLRELVLPRARDLRAAMTRLEVLRHLARACHSDEVLCHTDIWGSNLILSDDGTLHLLDWNGALIGPPEADLFMFAGTTFFPADRFGWFLDRYEAAFRRVPLHPEILGFYFYRRNLDDLADFLRSIIEGRVEAMEPAPMLDIIAGLLAETPLLEGLIEQVADLLAARP